MNDVLEIPIKSLTWLDQLVLKFTKRFLNEEPIYSSGEMIFEHLKADIEVDDETFNELYPHHIKKLSKRHWSPVAVAVMAAKYLAKRPNTKIMDIGSGAGKFCLVGAACTDGIFYGIEQRDYLIEVAEKIADKNDLRNIEFVHSNICEIDFSEYEAFYYFNSFFENIDTSCPIDNIIIPSTELFYSYSDYVKKQLHKMPVGTRLVTFCTDSEDIPNNFGLSYSYYDGYLNFWEKVF